MAVYAGIRLDRTIAVDSFVEKRFKTRREHHGFNSEFLHAGYVPDKRVDSFFHLPVEHAPVCLPLGQKLHLTLHLILGLTSR